MKRAYEIIVLLIIVFITACSIIEVPTDDDGVIDTPLGSFDNGFFIVNQGKVQNTDEAGTISFYNRATQQVAKNLFSSKNPEEHLGNQVQSMRIINNLGYIVAVNSDRIQVVDATNFQSLGAIRGFDKPRYILPIGSNRAYVSQFGRDGELGSIKIVDLNANTIIDSIPTRPGPDKMLKVDNFVYVANTGGFLLDSVITKIDISNHQIIKTIEVGLNPQGIQLDQNDNLWTIAQGSDMSGQFRDGQLTLIENDEVSFKITLSRGARNLVINNEGNQLFYTKDNSIFNHTLTQTNLTSVPFIDKPFTSLAIDPSTNLLVAGDAGNFNSIGEVYIYGLNGQEINQFEVGIVPIEFWFQ